MLENGFHSYQIEVQQLFKKYVGNANFNNWQTDYALKHFKSNTSPVQALVDYLENSVSPAVFKEVTTYIKEQENVEQKNH